MIGRFGAVTDQPTQRPEGPELFLRPEDMGGVWANFASVSHSPYECTIDFARLDFTADRPRGPVVARVNLSPLFVSQLLDALKRQWDLYVAKAMPDEAREGFEGPGTPGVA